MTSFNETTKLILEVAKQKAIGKGSTQEAKEKSFKLFEALKNASKDTALHNSIGKDIEHACRKSRNIYKKSSSVCTHYYSHFGQRAVGH